MGRKALRKHSAVPPRFPAFFAGHFVLTNISLPCNAGTAVQTTKRGPATSFTFTAREGTSTDFGRVQLPARLRRLHLSGGFCQSTFLCHSLYLINAIIPRITPVSRPAQGWTVTLLQTASSVCKAVRFRIVQADFIAAVSSKSVIPYVRCSRSGCSP